MATKTLKESFACRLWAEWSITQNVANNQSTIKLSLKVTTKVSIGPWGDFGGSYFGSKSDTFNGEIPYFSGTRTLKTVTKTVNHNAEGKGSFTCYWKWGVNSSWGEFVYPSGSFSISLPTIARASQPSVSSSSVQMGSSVTINTNRASSSFTHTLKYTFGGVTDTIATGVGASYTFTPQLSLANRIPSNTSAYGTITCDTYNGSTKIGSKTVGLILTVPSSVVPTIDGASTSEANSKVTMGLFVQSQSKIKVTITARGSYSSSISSYSTTFDGVTYGGSSFTTGTIYSSGTKTLSVTVTDSRGRKTTYSRQITITPYSQPQINGFSVYRSNSSGTADDDGTYAKISYNFSITSLNSKNSKSIQIQYQNGSTWTNLKTLSVYSENSSFVSSGFSVDKTYPIRIVVADSFSSNSRQIELKSEPVTFDILASGKGMAFGKVSSLENVLESEWAIKGNNGFCERTNQAQKVHFDYLSDNSGLGSFLACWQRLDDNNILLKSASYQKLIDTYLKWANISGKPSTFAPSTHNHGYSTTIGGMRATSSWLGFYDSYANAQNASGRKGYIGHDGRKNFAIYNETGGDVTIHSNSGTISMNEVYNRTAVQLWSGSVQSGNITVSNMSRYRYLAVLCGNASSTYATWITIPLPSSTCELRGGTSFNTTNIEHYTCSGKIDGNSIKMTEIGMKNFTTNAYTRLYFKRIVGIR